MTDHAELIAMLREVVESGMATTYDDDLNAAADALAALVAERDALREALKPFASQSRVSSLTEEAMILRAHAALAQGGET